MVIGTTIVDTDMRRHLESLGLNVRAEADAWSVALPSWRFDIAIEEDLIEEVARLHGFDQVPEAHQLAAVVMRPVTETRIDEDRAADILVGRGYHEAITYSFVDHTTQALFSPSAKGLRLTNPISEDLAEMRLTLWPGLVRAPPRESASATAARASSKWPYVRHDERKHERGAGHRRSRRRSCVTGAVGYPVNAGGLLRRQRRSQALIDATGEAAVFRFTPEEHPALHPGQAARLWRGEQPIGWLGRLHPEIESRLELTYSAIVFEVEAESLLAARVPRNREVSRFPSVRRDLAVVVDEKSTVEEILDRVRASAGALLTDLVLFDVYRGAGIGTGRKSLAIGLNLQDISRTLTDEETDAVVARVVSDLEGSYNATIRDK